MQIVKGTEHDIYAIACSMKNFEQHTDHVKVDVDYTTGRYKPMVRRGDAVFFILKDLEVRGAIGGIKARDLHNGELIAIETVWFVNPKFRGKGIALLNKFEEWAKEEGCTKIAMIHLQDSMPDSLKSFYEKRGYKHVESHYVREVIV